MSNYCDITEYVTKFKKEFRQALLDKGYKTQKKFCEDNNLIQERISNIISGKISTENIIKSGENTTYAEIFEKCLGNTEEYWIESCPYNIKNKMKSNSEESSELTDTTSKILIDIISNPNIKMSFAIAVEDFSSKIMDIIYSSVQKHNTISHGDNKPTNP